MHCDHCVMNVTMMLNRIDGVSADVHLSAARAVVSYDRDISDEVLKDAVEKNRVSGSQYYLIPFLYVLFIDPLEKIDQCVEEIAITQRITIAMIMVVSWKTWLE